MPVLSQLLKDIPALQIIGADDVNIASLQVDSRLVKPGDCFVAVRGAVTDGHLYMQGAVERGAKAVICEVLPEQLASDVTYVQVKESSKALGKLASAWYGHPSRELKVVGVTGTNGKTSVVTLLYRVFLALGMRAGLISTVQNCILHETIPSTHTTPDAITLQGLLRRMADAGCGYCFMEVSSHAVVQERIAGLHFTGAVFTNITHDHLDYHGTFANYIKAKKKFFDELPADAFALVNLDDRNARVMLQNTRARTYTFAVRSPADFKCKLIENGMEGLHLEIDGTEVHSRLMGEFNAYNLTAVYAVCRLLGVEKHACLTKLSSVTPPDGRFQQVISPKQKILGIVDYAHTPDALKNVLQTIGAVRTGNEQVITVVGCGGDRDKSKRPLMAEIACRYAHRVILTSDNPRSEDPEEIIRQMSEGIPPDEKKKVLQITDRAQAIRTAVALAGGRDIILVAGKGHETYQEVKGVKTHFDDREELLRAFAELDK
ncbi:MAG: UDP-N-acetylmuramoyl-L-alanyl-D-glutamate--2,6-diaminopimelate ligase [Chitinophagales bacterium]|nr:UDP-N-acetylmuramoyl-L-alanyl-D-glutamate--2,6-diaminopimelate ligase [Chitinophagales bacterium]MDW8418836.1 UDP-N-acetylmuramoyl-L-alanyl-D-glutamate--2,6-diaminopimelate ligase [Chitinophagales bacterium]